MKPPTKAQRAIMFAFIALVAGVVFVGVRQLAKPAPVRSWSGTVMHKPYTVVIRDRGVSDLEEASLRTQLSEVLVELEARFSRENGLGLVADFNKTTLSIPFYFGTEAWRVIDFEKRLTDAGGLTDLTLAQLEDIWAHAKATRKMPPDDDVKRVYYDTGMERLAAPAEPYIRRLKPEIKISLDTVAPGYIADRMASLLGENHVGSFRIEVGGVVISRDMQDLSSAIPVCTPANGGPPPAKVALMSGTMASVGVDDGFIYVDPRTGWPVSNDVHCVTVVGATGLETRGLAVSLYLLGPRDGLPWLATNGVAKGEALFIVNKPGGGFVIQRTHKFPLAGE